MASWHELPSPKTASELGEYFSDYLKASDTYREERSEPAYTSDGEFIPQESTFVPKGWNRRKPLVEASKSFMPKEDGGA